MSGATPQGPQNWGCPSTLGALPKWEAGHLGSVSASSASSSAPPPLGLLRLLLLGPLENVLLRATSLSLSLSLFQFDGDSAYVGMSDGNPELLSTSQVGVLSSLSGGWLEPRCFWDGGGRAAE